MQISKLASQVIERQDAAFKFLKTKRTLWDNAEKLFHNQLNDSVSSGTKSQVFDPKLATLTLERAYRVMAQTQTGKVIGISKNDLGDAKLKNLILDKYVLPNANAQFDFLTKMRMVDLYSNIYGNFFTLCDWDIKRNGYVGPDVWLLNIRDVFPQVGAMSLNDSDYIVIRTWQPLSYFERIAKDKNYKNVDKIITLLKGKSGSKQTRDAESMSKREENEYQDAVSAKNSGFFECFHMFERDRWVDLCVDAENTVYRDSDNPHDNGDLPVDCKYSIPLIDDPMGMGDFERGGSMQMTINSVWNLYLDAVKMSIFPPVLINEDAIASESSIQWMPTAKWQLRVGPGGAVANAVHPMNLTPQGIGTFNNTYQVATASLLNLFGTTDTTITSQTDPGLGKTPQALEQLKARENTRDNADRFFMEKYLTSLSKKMVNLIAKKQTSAITLRLFEEEIRMLARDYPEVREMYDEETGKLSIKKGSKNQLYDYEIVSGSTFATDQKAQLDFTQLLMEMYTKAQTPQGNTLVSDLDRAGYTFNFGELFKRFITNSGIQDYDKILIEKSEADKTQTTLDNDAALFNQVLQQAMGQGVPPMPQGMAAPQMPEMQGVPQGMPNMGQQLPEQGAVGI